MANTPPGGVKTRINRFKYITSDLKYYLQPEIFRVSRILQFLELRQMV